MQRFKTSMLSAALLVLPVMAMAEPPMDTKADIQKAADQYMAAYNNRDASALGKMHSDDATVSLSQWTVQGRPAIEAAFTKEFGAGVQFTNITVEQSQRTGDINVSRGTWAAEMKTPDGKTMPISGHWLIVGACQGGQGGSSCLISQHVGNTNMPPPQQASAK
jgi:ketosteroid isomerase-like protein